MLMAYLFVYFMKRMYIMGIRSIKVIFGHLLII